METIKKYYTKYEEVIKYLIFGVLTTLVNYIVYYSLKFLFNIDGETIYGTIINIIANIVAIIFAYATNRKFVFESKATGKKEVLKEFVSFCSCRIFAMVVDTIIYYVGCNILHISDFIVKTFSQVIIIILNYVSSKLIVFRKTEKQIS